MVSVVCNNALNRTVREFGIQDPGKLLDKTRELVIEQFEIVQVTEADSHGAVIKDGMDISVCHLNKKKNEVLWSGANNPIWIIRNGELLETKGDKQPVGKFEPSSPFTTHQIPLQSEDVVYIFTDGYADQFGGEKGKKFKSSSLKTLLIEIHKESMDEQLRLLNTNFDTWKGNFEQLDDVCIIGFRI
jgi:serine phosphatase RsbU (regulator of sigma subunit)